MENRKDRIFYALKTFKIENADPACKFGMTAHQYFRDRLEKEKPLKWVHTSGSKAAIRTFWSGDVECLVTFKLNATYDLQQGTSVANFYSQIAKLAFLIRENGLNDEQI